MKLLSFYVAATLVGAAHASCETLVCMQEGGVLDFCLTEPASYAEYKQRFEAGYTMPATGEIEEAQITRNVLRQGPRLNKGDLAEIDVELTPRFCGLPYEEGPGGFDCSPEDPMKYDAEWMSSCYNVGTAAVAPATCTPVLAGWEYFEEDKQACESTTLTPAEDQTCSDAMICTETAGLTGEPVAGVDGACRAKTDSCTCAADDRCTWMARCVYYDGSAQCNADDVEGQTSMVMYAAATFPSMATAVVVSIVFPVVLFFGWYVWRCCNLCGGRKANPGFLCPCRKAGACPKKSDMAVLNFTYGRKQTLCFKVFFLLFFILSLVASLIGMAGNNLLTDGLTGTVDVMVYELSLTVNSVTEVFAGIDDTGGAADAELPTDQIHEFKCTIADMQASINSDLPGIFDLRALAVLVICLIPMAVSALGLLAAACNSKVLSCCVALLMSMLMIIVWLSFGLHSYLGMIFGDLCLELDLFLHYPQGSAITVPFLPSDMNPCSADAEAPLRKIVNDMIYDIEEQAAEGLATGATVIRDFCNKAGDFSELSYFNINCEDITGTDKMLDGTGVGNYVVNDCTFMTLEIYQFAKDNIWIEDPGINSKREVNGVLEDTGANCRSDAETYDADTNRCPDKDPDNDCLPACGTEGPGANDDVKDLFNPFPPGLTITECAARPSSDWKSLQQCGSLDGDGCQFPKLQNLACQITGGMDDELQKLADFSDILEDQIKPIANCETVQDMFRSMYMPLCVDSMNGFALITLANGIGGVVMLIMIPFSVIATKRLDKTHQALKTAVTQDVSYVGSAGGATPNKVVLPPLTTNAASTPMM